MASRWRKVETVTDFIFLGSKITADGDGSHEIKRRLLLGCQSGGGPALRPGAVAQRPGREAALACASLAQRFPASSVLARAGAGCGSVGDVPGAWLA